MIGEQDYITEEMVNRLAEKMKESNGLRLHEDHGVRGMVSIMCESE